MTDLSQSFNKLLSLVYENIGGCLVEKWGENKYRWHNTIGTREEIEKAIVDAQSNIQNSLNKQHGI